MHNSLFGGPTGDYDTNISALVTNVTNYKKKTKSADSEIFYFMHASRATVYL
jgi:hypothetical protein